MKILVIDYHFYYYPENTSCLEDFIQFINAHYHSYIKLTRLETDNCTFPYFIQEETTEVYLNMATMRTISEANVTVLSRHDYDARLAEVVKKKCIDCVHYEEDSDGDPLTGHREKLSLDGTCWNYEKKANG